MKQKVNKRKGVDVRLDPRGRSREEKKEQTAECSQREKPPVEQANQENQRLSLLEANLDKKVSLLSKHLVGEEGVKGGEERNRKMEKVLANLTTWVERAKKS